MGGDRRGCSVIRLRRIKVPASKSRATRHPRSRRVRSRCEPQCGDRLAGHWRSNGAGDLFTVSYAHAYPSASYLVISAANAAAVALVRNGYLTETATGFTVRQPSTGDAVLPAGSYAITFNAPGA